MASTTTHLGLTKPASGEGYNIDVVNGNTQKIDDFAGECLNRNLGSVSTVSALSALLDTALAAMPSNGVKAFSLNFTAVDSPFTQATYLCTLYKTTTNTTYAQAVFRRVDQPVVIDAARNSNGWSYVLLQVSKWTEITSAFTVNSTYCSDFHAYTDGHQVFFAGYVKAGTADQTNFVTSIASGYRPIVPFAANAFWMNWTDSGKSIAALVLTSAIQIRTVGDIAGSGGVLVSGSYPI